MKKSYRIKIISKDDLYFTALYQLRFRDIVFRDLNLKSKKIVVQQKTKKDKVESLDKVYKIVKGHYVKIYKNCEKYKIPTKFHKPDNSLF